MSKMKEVKISIDEFRWFVDRWANAHEDVYIQMYEYACADTQVVTFIEVFMRDTESMYGIGTLYDLRISKKCHCSYIMDTLDANYKNILEHRKGFEV